MQKERERERERDRDRDRDRQRETDTETETETDRDRITHSVSRTKRKEVLIGVRGCVVHTGLSELFLLMCRSVPVLSRNKPECTFAWMCWSPSGP